MSTCRLCGGGELEVGEKGRLVKYGVRHFAHAQCGLRKWQSGFFARLSEWQLRQFPVLYAQREGLGEALQGALNEAEIRNKARERAHGR